MEFYRSLIIYIQQEPVLFNKSIIDNIIFGIEEQIKRMNLNADKIIKDFLAPNCTINSNVIEYNESKKEYLIESKPIKIGDNIWTLLMCI